jgi:putative ABC transport system ATP-binding protein
LISLENVTVSYAQATPLLDITCEFDSSVTAITGPSGSGKSTLLRVIAGLQTPTKGRIRIGAEPVRQPSWVSAGDSRVALIHQSYRLVDFLTVSQNLRLAAEVRSVEVNEARVIETLETVGLHAEFLNRQPNSLSGGEQQRVAIARALLCRVKVLLADEPTGALDQVNTERVTTVLREIGDRSGTNVIIATHDPLVANASTANFELVNGRLTPA